MNRTIMLLGVHGVGKSFLLKQLNYKSVSASELIREYKESDQKKRVKDISGNQSLLLNSIISKDLLAKEYILDGHCCLFDEEQNICLVEMEVFNNLGLCGIIVLEEDVDIICQRLKDRDGLIVKIDLMKEFQNQELKYAEKIARKLNIPFLRTKGNIDTVRNFIDIMWR